MIINWTDGANLDLENIFTFISEDNPTAAARVLQTIYTTTETRLKTPQSGRIGRVTGTYELVIPKLPYIVVYQIETETINVLRVYHTSRMWPEEF